MLLADNHIVKICDFGLTKDCYKYGKYVMKTETPLPLKWMPPESLKFDTFTTKSDVWSYGVFIWELFSLGETPYSGLQLGDDFTSKLLAGYRMSKPSFCPDAIHRNVITNCWELQPDDRPTFSGIHEYLSNFLELQLKSNYENITRLYTSLESADDEDDPSDLGYLAMDERRTLQTMTTFV